MNALLGAPHQGQTHSSGISSKAVPGATPLSGSPTAGSYTYSQRVHFHFSIYYTFQLQSLTVSLIKASITIKPQNTIISNMILFDDIGSYPLPAGTNKEWVAQAVKNRDPKLISILRDAMHQKITAGVDVPTYPQFQDMNQQFLGIINDESASEEPLIVRTEMARIMELEAIEEVGEEYYKKKRQEIECKGMRNRTSGTVFETVRGNSI